MGLRELRHFAAIVTLRFKGRNVYHWSAEEFNGFYSFQDPEVFFSDSKGQSYLEKAKRLLRPIYASKQLRRCHKSAKTSSTANDKSGTGAKIIVLAR